MRFSAALLCAPALLASQSMLVSARVTHVDNVAAPPGVTCASTWSLETMDRGFLIQAIDLFCKTYNGETLKPGEQFFASKTAWSSHYKGYPSKALHLKVKNVSKDKKSIVVRGNGGAKAMCGAAFRKPIDGCDTRGENGKRGGTYQKDGLEWKLDIYSCDRRRINDGLQGCATE